MSRGGRLRGECGTALVEVTWLALLLLAPGQATAAAVLSLRDQSLDPGRETLAFRCEPDPQNCLAPGSVITVTVGYSVPLPLLPTALGGQTPSIAVDAVHRVPYGTFREDRP